MKRLLSLLTILLILLSGVSGFSTDVSALNSYQNQHQAGIPIDTSRANMDGTSWAYLTSETQNSAILPVIASNIYVKQLRETSNKLSIFGINLFTAERDWTYLVHFVIPISTFQNIYHSIQPRAPNFIALV